ncbi:MAG TPA: hypothetical protein PLH01_05625 [Kiritimatiellia bacterium]|nr:hypothetical protein [Kiritimatiellia bacterium]
MPGRNVRRVMARGILLAALWAAAGGCRALREPESGPLPIRCYGEEAARLRGLPLTREIPVTSEARDVWMAVLEGELDKPENRRFLEETERLARHFRVLPADVSLRALYRALMREQVAAYYDPEKKRIAVVEVPGSGYPEGAANRALVDRFVYTHEYCHAVEDVHFDLERLTRAALSDLDANLALTSLVEGNAVLVGADNLCAAWPVNTATPLGAFLVSLVSRLELTDTVGAGLDAYPAFLAGALVRPYLDGAVFSNRLRREAGWQALDRVYRERLPVTTAEILYPERRYLRPFQPAEISLASDVMGQGPDVMQPVSTNRLGVLGTALWLGGERLASVRDFGFLQGWLGDRVFLAEAPDGTTCTIWLSYWERPGHARAFRKQVLRRLESDAFTGVLHAVRREGRLVAAVWMSGPGAEEAVCGEKASRALASRVEAETPSWFASWWEDLPSPVSVGPSGCGVLGGWAAELLGGTGFFHVRLACGGLLRVEHTPDRHYWGTAFGLLRHVGDRRSDFTFWQIPLVASWHAQGQGERRRFRWSVGAGLVATGEPDRIRVLRIPVWRSATAGKNIP